MVRTDASHPFFRGKTRNENVRRMRTILLSYGGAYNEATGYCQGMSDLLAPLLFTTMKPTRGEAEEADCL